MFVPAWSRPSSRSYHYGGPVNTAYYYPQPLPQAYTRDIVSRTSYFPMGQYVSSFYTTQVPQLPVPKLRQMVPISPVKSESLKISLMSWNILADCFASTTQHPQCPVDAISWNYRLKHILSEITRRKPDILCLQELDHFDDIDRITSQMGYKGINKARTRNVFRESDGCAIFYRSDKYKLLEKKEVLLDHAAATDLVTKNFSAPHEFIRNNVAILALFECIEQNTPISGSQFVVANTHFFWNPEKTQIKLVQAQYLLEQLRAALVQWKNDAVILAGDFNSEPMSGVHEYITTGRLGPANHDRRFFPAFDCQHEFKLHSAYASQGDPVTNWTLGYSGCLDYIFYTPSRLRCVRILEKQDPSDPVLMTYKAAPNPIMPSDHTQLVAEFELERDAPPRSRIA